MAETTYNVTIPHTSPLIYYDNFSTECPDKDSNGFPVCDDGKGLHIAANSTGRMRIDFAGSAIYVYGSVDEGMEYTWFLDYDAKTIGKPNGNLLIAVENLKFDSSKTRSTLEINLTQFKSAARFQFSKADVVVGTGVTGAQTVVDSYKPGNDSVQLMDGWVANDTLSGYHYYQSNSSSLLARMNFQGAAVWVWGFCGHRGQFVRGSYGSVSVDSGIDFLTLMDPTRETTLDHKCLIHWKSGLDVTQPHNITYDARERLVLFESFEVLRVVGGTSSANRANNPIRAIAAGVVGGLAVLFAVALIIVLIRKRRSKQRKVLPAVVALEPKFSSATSLPPSQSSKF